MSNNIMTMLAHLGDDQSYREGSVDGYWAGFDAGMTEMRRYIMGERDTNPCDDVPSDFHPLGHRYLSREEIG